MSANRPCFHNFFIEALIFSPGTIILSPTLSPEILIRVEWSRYLVPEMVIPPIIYSLGLLYSIVDKSLCRATCALVCV